MMMLRTLAFFTLLGIIPFVGLAEEKPKNWEEGKLLDSEQESVFAGTSTFSTGPNTSTGVPIYRTYRTFAIEGKTHIYLVRQHLRWRCSKSVKLTVNGPVKFAVEEKKIYVIDEDDKEHEMQIFKEILKEGLEAPPGALQPENGTHSSPSGSSSQEALHSTVIIKSVPEGADITIDGKSFGNTPSIVQLDPGDHEIVLQMKESGVSDGKAQVPSYHSWKRTLTVNPGSTVTINAPLEKIQ